jgi:4-alpha-glucanotransferase
LQEHPDEINLFIATQFLFDRQWKAIKAYANAKGIKIVGDMPIYVGGHSADVWANQVGRGALMDGALMVLLMVWCGSA